MNYVLYVLALVSLSQASILIRLAAAPIEVIGFWRLLGAFLIVSLFFPYKKLKKLPKGDLIWCGISGLMFFCHLWTYFFSVQNTSIANTMILFATNPLFTALATVFIFKQKLTPKLMIAYFFAFVGLILLLAEKLSLQNLSWLGEGAALLTAALYSAYVITGQKARHNIPNLVYTPIIYLITTFGFLIIGICKGVQWTNYPPQTWYSILGLIIFPTLMGHALFTYLLKFLNVNWMSCGKLIEPLLSSLMAALLFNESVSLFTAAAYLLSSISIFMLFLSKKESQNKYAK